MSFRWSRNRIHYGIVLDASPSGFDRGAATFSSVFVDEDDLDTLFIFYTGAKDISWSRSAIGLATSRDFVRFRKISNNPVLEGMRSSFCCKEALTPAVTKLGNRFYMVFSGRSSANSFRRLGLAWASDPRGPWHIITELSKRFPAWGNGHLENGPSLVKIKDDTVLVFYSNVSSAGLDVVNFLRRLFFQRELSLAWLDFAAFLRRYLIRRVGVLKLRIRGPSKSGVEVYGFSGSPLKNLNGPKGSWNESLFCPGYFHLKGLHYLVPATAVYSFRFPYRRYIGTVAGNSPLFDNAVFGFEKLIDGPSEKSAVMPSIKGEISLDSPSPFLSSDNEVLYLYYSVMDHLDRVWKTALTTFSLKQEQNGYFI